jgi:hypothetical protein
MLKVTTVLLTVMACKYHHHYHYYLLSWPRIFIILLTIQLPSVFEYSIDRL